MIDFIEAESFSLLSVTYPGPSYGMGVILAAAIYLVQRLRRTCSVLSIVVGTRDPTTECGTAFRIMCLA